MGVRILTMILFFAATLSYAQQDKSSYKSLKSRSSRSETEQLLNEAESLKGNNPDEALGRVRDALAMSIAQGNKFGEGRAYILLAEINEGILEWRLALDNYSRAYESLGDFKSSKEFLKSIVGKGRMSLKLGDYPPSLSYFEDALRYAEDEAEKNEIKLLISDVYYGMERYQDALDVLPPMSPSKKVRASGIENRVQNQQAKIYARLNELEKTQDLYKNSLNTLREEKNFTPEEQKSVQQTKDEITSTLRGQKRYDEEIDIRKQAIDYNIDSKNMAEVTKDKVEISKTLEAKGETSAAIKAAEEAAIIADTITNSKEQANAFLALANLYEKNNQPAKALQSYSKYSRAAGRTQLEYEARLNEKSELIRMQREIEEVVKDVSIGQREETIERATVFRQQLIIYGLIVIILIIGVTSYFIYKNAAASKTANQLLALKSLRSQMNPHFIFNALNSVNHFISQQDERTANRFLSDFSSLMRLVLENSQQDFIPLVKEHEILSLYLKLEHYRFRDRFDYQINVDAQINMDVIEVPPMLIQPYIENAVWHGLRYKEEKGELLLRIYRENGNLVAEIEDNGIGRKRSEEVKTVNQKKHLSTGLKNIEERLTIINKVYKTGCRVSIEDLESGTRVRVYLPINQVQES